jgi:hypothetical protein
MMGFGCLNGIWLTIVPRSINVHKTANARFPIVFLWQCRPINISDVSVAFHNFSTSPIVGNIKSSQALVVQ